jgi:hypothetical protein
VKEQVKQHRSVLFKHSVYGSACLVVNILGCLTIFGLLAAEVSLLWSGLLFVVTIFTGVGFINHLVFMIVYSLTELKQK